MNRARIRSTAVQKDPEKELGGRGTLGIPLSGHDWCHCKRKHIAKIRFLLCFPVFKYMGKCVHYHKVGMCTLS